MADRFVRLRWVVLAVLTLTVAGCAHSPDGPRGGFLGRGLASTGGGRQKGSPRLQLAYAKWQEQIGNAAQARESYELVLQDDPRSVDAVLGLARLDQLAGRREQAEMGYQKALRLKPNYPPALDAAGQFYASQNRWPEAVAMLRGALNAAPDEPVYRYHLAVALARSGDLGGAMPHFAATVGEAEAHYNIGYILYEQGDLAAAEQQFVQATIKKPNLAQAQTMLEDIRRSRDEQLLMAASPPAATRAPAAAPGQPAPEMWAGAPAVPQPPADDLPPGLRPTGERQRTATFRPQGPSLVQPASPEPWPTPRDTAGVSQTDDSEFVLPVGLSRQQMEQWENQQQRP